MEQKHQMLHNLQNHDNHRYSAYYYNIFFWKLYNNNKHANKNI